MRTALRGALSGVALHDQVAAVLREHSGADRWLSPTDISQVLGPYTLWELACGHEDCTREEHRRVFGPRRYQNATLNPHLTALERHGLVERLVLGPHTNTPHRWRWIGASPTKGQ